MLWNLESDSPTAGLKSGCIFLEVISLLWKQCTIPEPQRIKEMEYNGYPVNVFFVEF